MLNDATCMQPIPAQHRPVELAGQIAAALIDEGEHVVAVDDPRRGKIGPIVGSVKTGEPVSAGVHTSSRCCHLADRRGLT